MGSPQQSFSSDRVEAIVGSDSRFHPGVLSKGLIDFSYCRLVALSVLIWIPNSLRPWLHTLCKCSLFTTFLEVLWGRKEVWLMKNNWLSVSDSLPFQSNLLFPLVNQLVWKAWSDRCWEQGNCLLLRMIWSPGLIEIAALLLVNPQDLHWHSSPSLCLCTHGICIKGNPYLLLSWHFRNTPLWLFLYS